MQMNSFWEFGTETLIKDVHGEARLFVLSGLWPCWHWRSVALAPIRQTQCHRGEEMRRWFDAAAFKLQVCLKDFHLHM